LQVLLADMNDKFFEGEEEPTVDKDPHGIK
jgi:hypothetical protein